MTMILLKERFKSWFKEKLVTVPQGVTLPQGEFCETGIFWSSCLRFIWEFGHCFSLGLFLKVSVCFLTEMQSPFNSCKWFSTKESLIIYLTEIFLAVSYYDFTLRGWRFSVSVKGLNPKGNQSWIGRTGAEAEDPVLWPPDMKSRLTGKDPDAGKDWRQEKGTTEDETVGRNHRFKAHEFEQTPGDCEGQGRLVCCSPRGCKLDTTERLTNNKRDSQEFSSSLQRELQGKSSRNAGGILLPSSGTIKPLSTVTQLFRDRDEMKIQGLWLDYWFSAKPPTTRGFSAGLWAGPGRGARR